MHVTSIFQGKTRQHNEKGRYLTDVTVQNKSKRVKQCPELVGAIYIKKNIFNVRASVYTPS